MISDTAWETVFLTGGTGFLGGHLRSALADTDITVRHLVRPNSAVTPKAGEEIIRGDLTEDQTFPLDDVDVVCHLAAQTDIQGAVDNPANTWEVNANGTLNLLESARKGDIDRFLLASTASIYGTPQYLPIDETHPMNPREPYGASKLAADRLVNAYAHSYDLPTVTARLFNTYGPRQPEYNVIGHIIQQSLANDVVEVGNLSPSRDFLYVADAVDALVTVLTDGALGEAYNIGSGSETTIKEVTDLIRELVEDDIEIVSKADKQRDDDIEIERHLADTSKIADIGWQPTVSLRSGLQSTIEYFQSTH